MKRIVVVLCCLIGVFHAFSQNCVVKGTVCDENFNPVSTEIVYCVKPVNHYVFTDQNGHFEIAIEEQTDTLFVSNWNEVVQIPVSCPSLKELTIVLKREAKLQFLLDNVTVVGFQKTSPNVSNVSMADKKIVQDVPFILNDLPSVVATSETGTGIGYTNLRVRGADMSRMNITVDGIPLNDAESQDVYFVNLGDFSSSVENVELQRGVGSSASGTSSFGASINFETKEPNGFNKPSGEVSAAIGSFNTQKLSVAASSGKLADRFMIDVRFGGLHSDGWVQRGTCKNHSFDVMATYRKNHSELKAKVLYGKQKTGITWEGLPEEMLDKDLTYNVAGRYYDDEGNEHFYDNETDNYTQTHYILSYRYRKDTVVSHKTFQNVFSVSLFATTGNGYYEQYKDDASLEDYGFSPSVHDLIRQKAMDNIHYGYVSNFSLRRGGLKYSFGNSYSIYDGNHFGNVIWIQDNAEVDISKPYYENNGLKKDFNLYANLDYSYKKISLYGDVQYRNVSYKMLGVDDDLTIMDHVFDWSFFNPKIGGKYQISRKECLTTIFSVSNREPTRSNLKDAAKQIDAKELLPETLFDFEFGYRWSSEKIDVSANCYLMQYDNQLVQTGKLNDVGDAILENVKNSYRCGLELSTSWWIFKKLNWSGNFNFSQNKIRNYVEYALDYDEDWNEIQKITNLETTDISYSPNFVSTNRISYSPINRLVLELTNKIVGKQYFDNSSDKNRMLDAYTVFDCSVSYIIRGLKAQFSVYNLLNKNYISNAYGGNWYEQGTEYSWKYYFPQAGTHFTFSATYSF